ncbi:sulfatase-like hydrolase/transferase [Marinoscillum furvescens]|uniref:Putative secreted protein (Por secretion system target) n=1 Tax=Marinoscillum furvescens DSM 4134 TaxID=1122208 RepID=A0A3D9L0N8_MARFU|nr:sulfatase-like hydrolase/transferase [Marinoscillum furvescens]RED96001.1 putative secreted protein (Por secretion system target) [Marinoscillum furvescens DSM 4134]
MRLILALLLVISLQATAQDRPNILWILTDDQRMDSNGIFNKTTTGISDSPLGMVSSPNVDALAAEGVFFVNNYCNSPACAPSRGSMITGKYPHHTGIYGFEQTHDQVDYFTKTLPELMSDLGYRTTLMGKSGYRIFEWGPGVTWNDLGFYDFKIDNKNDLAKLGFSDWFSNVFWEGGKKVGVRNEFHFPDGSMKYYYTEREGGLTAQDAADKAAIVEELDLLFSYTRSNPNLIIGGVNSQESGKTLDGYVLDEFKNYLENQDKTYTTLAGKTVQGAKPSQPQFLSLSFHFPHTPVMPPKEYRDKFKDEIYAIPEFDQSEVDKLPAQMKDLYEQLQIDGLSYEEKQQAIRDYYAFCAYGDHLVGEAIDAFKAYSERNGQEYLILYVTGDHGWHLGEQGIEAKFTPWQLSNHGAAIVVSSDKTKYPPGEVYEGFTEYVDFVPTMLAAAGADLSNEAYEFLDGQDMGARLQEDDVPKAYIIGEINSVGGPRAYMRTEDFAFSMRTRKGWGRPGKQYAPNENIEWALNASFEEASLALYDLRVDPAERSNVSFDPAYKELTEWFRQKLGNIVLGDGRIETDWSQQNVWNRTDFALGADDKKLNIPEEIVPKVAHVKIAESRMEVEPGERYQLTAEAGAEPITWSSNNPEVATVSATGEVTCLAEGSAGIHATLANGASDVCVVYTAQETPEEPALGAKKKSKLAHPFPNPFENELNIEGLKGQIDQIEVVDEAGRQIEQITGVHSLEMKYIGKEWKSGTYFLRLYRGDEVEVFKVLKK